MADKKIILAYNVANQPIAQEIDFHLSPAGFDFEHFICDEDSDFLQVRLQNVSDLVCMLISDNFLRSANCMYELLPAFQELARANRVKPIITDGIRQNPDTGAYESYPTSFDRVSNVIQYMNYWQDQYLEVRRQKKQVVSVSETSLLTDNQGDAEQAEVVVDESTLNEQLKIIRSISSEIGEFLRFLRNRDYATLEEFQHDNYYVFFKFVNQLGLHAAFTLPKTVEETVADAVSESLPNEDVVEEELEELDFSAIPGMDLLENQAEDNATEAEAASDVVTENLETVLESDLGTSNLQNGLIEDQTVNIEPPSEEETEVELDSAVAIKSAEAFLEEVRSLKESRSEEALTAAQQGLEIYPTDANLRYEYANLLLEQNEDISAARVQLDLLLSANPNHVEAAFLAGKLAEIQEDFVAAKGHYEKVVALHPEQVEVYYRLGNILANKFDNAQSQASEMFAKTISLDPTNADAHYQFAALQDEFFDLPRKAIEHYKATLNLQPNHPYANLDLALVYHQIGEAESAQTAYLKAIDITPDLQTQEYDELFLNTINKKETPAPMPIQKQEESLQPGVMNTLKEDIKRLENLLLQNRKILELGQPASVLEELREAEEAKPVHKRVDEVVLITGATSGIGKATADLFAAEGYRLILTGRRTERLEELKAQYETDHESDVLILAFDVRDPMAVEEVVQNLSEEWQGVDILINNAGLAVGLDFIHEGKLQDWETMIDTNVKGLLYMTRAVAPNMVKQRKGHIINVCSIAGKEVYPKGAVYCATKHAVDALTKGMRIDLFQHNIKVSQVAPAHVEETEFAKVRFYGDEERAKIYEDFNPLKSSDVADAIYFIATRPYYVNIQDVVLSGNQQASATMIDRSGRIAEVVTEIAEETETNTENGENTALQDQEE